MKYIKDFVSFFSFFVVFILGYFIFVNPQIAYASTTDLSPTSSYIYEQHSNHNPDGIGKFYMGREIARVMGHTGAGWLERGSREVEEQPSKIVNALGLKPNNIVADIGAGTGYLSFLIAPMLREGKVLAVDIQPEMLEIIGYFQQEKNISNVKPILATETSPNLSPESIDLALMVDAYHEFAYPREMLTGIVKALKKGGRVAFVEYRGENPFIMIKALHKMTQKQVKKEMQAVGLVWRETRNILPQQHIIIFEKPVA
ncbi:class I SAM-dependent methyltransferase [Brunnivagina elsteri]|uniref:SAM-dependent methyltransferase n=1 Tax=Brunnivagina elsteri CCALA 953 TaxID=987040 RepID=A0A2A2TFA7_9CYAN|nr:class I SAM-dependent methyltransferase [Calothrix elsteri]PAX52440.1 SAM-dependent methyltransferase [Calothrix elsteri CCALA 953]